MGKHGNRKGFNHRRGKMKSFTELEEDGEEGIDDYTSNPSISSAQEPDSDQESHEDEEETDVGSALADDTSVPSKFSLYQHSVQSPKGDISYLQKFFMMYVGGRVPLHLQEDFCGTALLSVEWLHGDPRRTAVALDLDIDALKWCVDNNVNRIGADVSPRIFLFHGNVLQPQESQLLNLDSNTNSTSMQKMSLEDVIEGDESNPPLERDFTEAKHLKDVRLPARDVICAFNYSCCCLHSRRDLISYFKHALSSLSKKGGIFVMDLYGGTSSEGPIKMQRKFPNFTYTWEQAEFDIIQRKTRISLHYNLHKQKRKIRHAFSYSWRLWSLPEVKECMEEAGFQRVYFWVRSMPDSALIKCVDGLSVGRDLKYEEATSFQQRDSWNAYVIGVA